jgi:lysophospholipase L1-like esterase
MNPVLSVRPSFKAMTCFCALLVCSLHCSFAANADRFARWEKDIKAFEASDQTNPPPRHAILFIGSSSIRMWTTLARDFPEHRVINRGFGGSEIADSVHFAERIVFPYEPRMIVMYAGGNDINSGKSPEQVATDFETFVTKTRSRLPEVRIAYISIAPNPARWAQIEKIRTANKIIEEFCAKGERLTFINAFQHMLGSDGLPRPEIFLNDRLHMNAKGYELWSKIVKPYLDQATTNGLPASTLSRVQHRFACTDYSQGKVFIVASNGTVEWEYPAPSCNDLWVLSNGNLLYNTGHGVKEVTRDKQVVFSYESKSEIYACQRLADGNTFIGDCSSGRLLEIAPDGNIVKEVQLLPEGRQGGHVLMRNARRLDNGHYLVAHYGEQVVKEYDGQGRVVKEFPAPGGPHSVVRLPNGHTLIAVGDLVKQGNKVFEVDADGRVVWAVTADELPGINLKFMAGLQRLPNGNTIMSNWQGHGQFGSGPHLVEVTPDKRVVWTFADHQTMKTVSSIQVLDTPADPTKGEVWH